MSAKFRPRCPHPRGRALEGKGCPSQLAPSPQDFLVSPGPARPAQRSLGPSRQGPVPPVPIPQYPDSDLNWQVLLTSGRIGHLVIVPIFRRVTPSGGGCELTTAASLMRLSSTITCLSCLDLRRGSHCMPCLRRNTSGSPAAQKRPARPCPPRPLCTMSCLSVGLGVTQLARTWTDHDQPVPHPDTRSRFRVTRRCVRSACAPQHNASQHDTLQHWRSRHRSRPVLSAYRSPSQHRNAWRAGCNVPCESPGGLAWAWASGFGSGPRWHGMRQCCQSTRCEAQVTG